MNRCTERLYNGIVKENPTFVQMLGMCPTLAVTTSAINGIGMGLTTTVILVMSNMMISLLRKLVPDRVRIPAFIIVIASFVTIVQFLLEGFIPSLYDSLGIFIPLIVVNCIILGRAESYASKNPILPSIFDGLGMGLGFTVGLTSIGAFRELLGAGTIFGLRIMPSAYQPITIFILAPGAFFVLAFLIAAQNKIRMKKAQEAGELYHVCKDEDCSHCTNAMCGGRFFAFSSEVEGEGANEDAGITETAAADEEKQEESVAENAAETSEEAPSEGEGSEAGGGSQGSEPESENIGEESETEETVAESEAIATEPEEEADEQVEPEKADMNSDVQEQAEVGKSEVGNAESETGEAEPEVESTESETGEAEPEVENTESETGEAESERVEEPEASENGKEA